MTVKKAIGLILVVALLIAGGLYLRQVEHADQENMRDLYSMVEPLQRERESLAKERDQLETDYALEMRDVGTVELLFRELDRRIFSDVYPLMRDRGIIGVLGISNEEYPGLQSKLSLEQYNRLLMDGWGSCFLYDRKPTEFREWYNNLAHHLEHDKLPVPSTVFFLDNSNYDSEMDEVLDWIRVNFLPAKNVLHGHTSYGLKHILQDDTGIYLTNNEFKDAMMLCGYEPSNPNELNWHYRIKKRSPAFSLWRKRYGA